MSIPRNVVNLAGWWYRNRPNSVAVWHDGVETTWAEFHERTNGLADGLTDRGVRQGDRVGILSENRLEWLESAVAVLKAGAAIVPLNTNLTTDELAYIVGHAKLRTLLHSEATRDGATRVAELLLDGSSSRPILLGSPAYEAIATQPSSSDRWLNVGDDEPAVIGYTSGTTGRPKGVVLTHGNIHWLTAIRQLEDPSFTSEVRSLTLQPLFFTAILVLHFLPTFMVGGRFYLMDGLDVDRLIGTLERERINNLWAIPLVYAELAHHPDFGQADLDSLVSLCTGGTRVPVPVLQQWHRKGVALRQGYGSTETGGLVTFARPEEALAHPERAGAAVPGVRVRIIDDEGCEVELGDHGEIAVKSPAAFSEYLFAPSETAASFTDDGWYRSGDIGLMHEDGSISILGRSKDMIISGGVNVYPAEVERVISEIPGVVDVAVVAGRHPRWDEVPVALVRGHVAETEILARCREMLQKYAVPRGVVLCDEPFPTTASGKVHKPTLRDRYATYLEEGWPDRE